MLNPKARLKPNPETGKPTTHIRLRIDALIDGISEKKGQLIIPTPSLTEALTWSDNPQEYINLLRTFACIEIVPFDEKASLELALINNKAISSGDKKSGVEATWQEVKFDRQIVTIARVSGATVLYTDDDNQSAFAKLAGLEVRHTWDLPLPAKYAQMPLFEDDEKNG